MYICMNMYYTASTPRSSDPQEIQDGVIVGAGAKPLKVYKLERDRRLNMSISRARESLLEHAAIHCEQPASAVQQHNQHPPFSVRISVVASVNRARWTLLRYSNVGDVNVPYEMPSPARWLYARRLGWK